MLTFLMIIGLLSCNSIEKEDFSFEVQSTSMTGSMRGLDVLNESCVWISGSGGEYCFTTDAGASWTKSVVPGAELLDFRDLHVFSEKSALLMSAGPGEASRVYRTDDAGQSWVLCYQNTDSLAFFDGMDFLNDNEGVIFSDPVDSKLNLMVTKDGGRNWVRQNPESLPELKTGEYAFAASGTSIMYDLDGGLWIATGGSEARIWHANSIDGLWKIFTPPVIQGDPAAGLFSVSLQSDSKRIAVGGHYQKMDIMGSNVVLWDEKSQDWFVPEGGKSLPFMECVRWVSDDAVVAAGPPGVFFSPDSGESWTRIYDDGFHTFDVSQKGRVGWLALNKGIVKRMSW